MPESRICSVCGESKPADTANYGEKRGKLKPQCRACEASAQRLRDREDAARELAHAEEPDVERLRLCAPWGTSLDREAVAALGTHGSLVAAAEALGMTSRQLRGRLQELERRAARKGWSPAHDMRATVPEGFRVKGVSTYHKLLPDGTRVATGQWTKSASDADSKLEILAAAFDRLGDRVRGLAEPAPEPTVLLDDLLCVYPMGDPHLGMYAWAAECGEDFDLDIATRHLYAAADHLVSLAPPAREALVVNLGDFFHADSNAGTTTKGTRVDVDTRHPKVYEAGLGTMRRIIDRALLKHEHVTVGCQIGNHDENAAMMMAVGLAAVYEREPRVTIDKSPAMFHRLRFGKCLIGWTHGHTVKHADLGEIMACDWAQDWGETLYRHFYVGHVHHDTVKEKRGMTIETLRTLAAKDAWHAGQGYRAGRDMKLDVWHRKFGRINRHIVGIQQIAGGSK